MRPVIAHCHAALGELPRLTGKQAQSEEHRHAAEVMYREMGMTYRLELAP